MLTHRRALGAAAVSIVWILSMSAFAQPDRAPSGEAAQRAAPRYEQRVYDLATLLARVPDRPGPRIDLRPGSAPAGGVAGAAFTLDEPLAAFASADLLIALIKTNIAEDSWSDQRTSIEAAGEELIVVQTPEVQQKIARMMAYLRRASELQIVVDGTLALVDDGALDAWRSGAANPAALSDAGAKALAEALDKGDRAARLGSLRVIARNGQRTSSQSLTQHSFTADYDADVVAGAAAMTPRHQLVTLGAVLDVRPLYTRGQLACEVRFTRQSSPVPFPQFETGLPGTGPLDLPETAMSRVETTVSGQDGQTLLAGRVAVADPAAPRGAPARSLCFFVRPAIVPAAEAQPPASDEKRQMRLFDVGSLIQRLQDFPGWNITLIPETGGVAVEAVESREALKPETLIRAIRHNVAPESWENTRNTIGIEGRFLFARQAPDVLDAVGRRLDGMAARRWRMIVLRADLLAADPAEHRALLGKYPRLGAGAARLEAAEAAEILSRAAKGEGLTRAASGEVAGMNRQRVNIEQGRRQCYVRQYDVVTAPLVAVHDPSIDLVNDGLVVDCKPILGGDGKTVHAELKVTFAQLERPIAVKRVDGKGLPFHVPAMSIGRIRASLVAPAGEPMLVGIGGPVRLAGGEKHLLAIVRLTPVTE